MRAAFALLICLIVGCAHNDHDEMNKSWIATTRPLEHELMSNPTIVITAAPDWTNFTLHGIKMGDDETLINKKQIVEMNDRGWAMLRDGNRFRVLNGKIDALGMWDQRLISQMGITAEDMVREKFGKPDDSVRVTDFITIYAYQQGHIHVIWNGLEGHVSAVNVMQNTGNLHEGQISE